MKKSYAFELLMVACLASASPASAAEKARTISDLPGFPRQVLQRTISWTLYRELLVSPVQAWVEVRGVLSGTHIYGERVSHSEGDGSFDQYALQLARDWQIAGAYNLDRVNPTNPVTLNVLVYEIADGTMAISFPSLGNSGSEQVRYYGAAKLAVQQPDGRWADLKLPEGATGKVWSIRSDMRNNFALEMKLNNFEPSR